MQKLPNGVFHFLFFFIKQQKFGFLMLAILSTAAMSANSTLWPMVVGDLVDFLEKISHNKHNAISLLKFQLIIAFTLWACIELMQRSKGMMLGLVMPKFEANIRMFNFAYVIKQPYIYFTQKHVNAIAYRVDDIPRGCRLIADNIISVFLPLLISIGIATAIFFTMHYILSVVFFIWIIIHLSLLSIFCYKSAKYTSYQSEARAGVQSQISDAIKNYFNIHIYNSTQHEIEIANRAQDIEKIKYKFAMFFMEKCKLILSIISIISITVLLYSAIRLWQSNIITTGDVVFMINSTMNIITTMWFAADEVTYTFGEIGLLKKSIDIVHNATLLPQEDEFAKKTNLKVVNGRIEYQNVGFYYQNGYRIFSNKSIIIEGKQKIGLVGFSGSGKTTFVNLIMRLYPLSNGKIIIDDQDISDVNIESLHSNISLIPQSPMMFNRSIKENITYGVFDATEDEIIEASIKANCHEFITKLPKQYDTIIGGMSGLKISGGEGQRISIARAILKNVPILIMDEATSALDIVAENKVKAGANSIMNDKTVIVIAHRLSTVLDMDRILVFDKGRIIEDGSHKELIAKGDYYTMLWNLQHDGLFPDKKL